MEKACSEERGRREREKNARGLKDAIVWQGLLVKPENKLRMNKDNEVHAAKYSDAPRARIARSRTYCVSVARARICVYIFEKILLRARIYLLEIFRLAEASLAR